MRQYRVAAALIALCFASTSALPEDAKPAAEAAAPASTAAAPASPVKVRRVVRHRPLSSDGQMISTKTVAQRTALCRADCSPAKYDAKTTVGVHGIYRSYQQTDPNLVSVDGKRQYAECVSTCLAPLPTVYVQRAVFALGINWFGQTKQSCLDCHERGH